jgi:hypothetical protein
MQVVMKYVLIYHTRMRLVKNEVKKSQWKENKNTFVRGSLIFKHKYISNACVQIDG